MRLKYMFKKPCPKCPYTLGLVKTPKNPCPECKLKHYGTYEWLQKQLLRRQSSTGKREDTDI